MVEKEKSEFFYFIIKKKVIFNFNSGNYFKFYEKIT